MPLQHDRLIAYLAAQPPEVRSVTLTFAEVGELLGEPLPVTARTPVWWARRLVKARRPGWRLLSPHITPDGWAVTFRRLPPDTTP